MDEAVDRRVLGAVRFVDATTALPVAAPLRVATGGARLVRNRRNLFVVVDAPGLEEHTAAFLAPPAAPPPASVPVPLTVRDPERRYLARRATIHLPRDPDPAHADQPQSLFQPVDVPLYPAPGAPLAAGWAAVRAGGVAAGQDTPLAGALIRVLGTSDNSRLALGLTDDRGEALVPVASIPVTSWSTDDDDEVVTTAVDVTVQAVYDPAAPTVPDPDDLEARQELLPRVSQTAQLAAGRVVMVRLAVPLP